MADEDDRPFLAGLVIRRSAIGQQFPIGMIVDGGIDATPVELLGKHVHAQSEKMFRSPRNK